MLIADAAPLIGAVAPWWVPLITGAGGCIVALVLGHILLLGRKYITMAEHQSYVERAERNEQRLMEQNEKLETANDTLTDALRVSRDQNTQLLNSNEISNGLLRALHDLARERGGGHAASSQEA